MKETGKTYRIQHKYKWKENDKEDTNTYAGARTGKVMAEVGGASSGGGGASQERAAAVV